MFRTSFDVRDVHLPYIKVYRWQRKLPVMVIHKHTLSLSMALIRERTMPTERPPLVGELVPTFFLRIEVVAWSAQRIPTVVNLDFLDWSRYFFFQVAPQLSSRGWVDPVPDPPLLRKSGNAENRTQDLWICSQKLWPLYHRGILKFWFYFVVSYGYQMLLLLRYEHSFQCWIPPSVSKLSTFRLVIDERNLKLVYLINDKNITLLLILIRFERM
jgi:hypothetical protein